VLVSNTGNSSASSLIVTDILPAQTLFVSGSIRSGTTCAGATTVEDDNNTGADESDPIGATINASTLTATTATLAKNSSFAIAFNATVQ
jgi:hypothetical protein